MRLERWIDDISDLIAPLLKRGIEGDFNNQAQNLSSPLFFKEENITATDRENDQERRLDLKTPVAAIVIHSWQTNAETARRFHFFASTRQTFPAPSSDTSNEPSVHTATPTGRP